MLTTQPRFRPAQISLHPFSLASTAVGRLSFSPSEAEHTEPHAQQIHA